MPRPRISSNKIGCKAEPLSTVYILNWRAKRAKSEEVDGKRRIASHARMYVCALSRNSSLPGECTEVFLTRRLKKRKWSSWRTRHRYARFFNGENGCRFEGRRKETCLVNSCHVKDDVVVLFSLNYSIETVTLDVIQVRVSRNYF